MSHETENAKSELEQSGHALAQPLQVVINNQEEIRLSLSEATHKLAKLETAVLGDEQYHHEGILPTLANHEKRIRSLENWRTYVLAVGFTLMLIWHIIKPFLTKIP